MKLPHITIEYREEESFAIGKMSPTMIVGFGLHWAWVYLVMYNSPALFHPQNAEYQQAFFSSSLTVFFAIFLCYGIFLKQFRRLFGTAHQRRRNRFVAVCLVVASMTLLFGVGTPGAAGAACALVAGVLSGVGSAVLLMSFGVSFSVCDVATTTISAALATVVTSTIYGVITATNIVLHPLGVALCFALPVLEILCLNRCSSQLVDNLEFCELTLPTRTSRFAPRICLPCFLMGIALGTIRNRVIPATSGSSEAFSPSDFALVVVLAGIAACLALRKHGEHQRQTTYFAFRTMLPVVAILLAASAALSPQDETLLSFCLFASYLMLEMSLWITLADLSQKYRISTFLVFGFGHGASAAGTLAAATALPHLLSGISASPNDIVPVMTVLVLLILCYSTMPNGTEIRSTLDKGKLCPALFDETDFLSTAKSDDASASATDAAPKANSNSRIHEQAKEQEASTETGLPIKTASKAERNTGENPRHAETTEKAQENKGEPRHMGHFKRKCLTVADTYLLSRRETEVLFLLAKGLNSTAIQKNLYISAGTTNTHTRNIYRKLNVHSQQDLIALVESASDES